MKKAEKKFGKFRIILPAIIGHILEFYDFTIYAVFAVELGQLFFPQSSSLSQLLSSLGVFSAGFIMRPIGGILFGHIGDKYGRKLALTISVTGMAVVTGMIGILPDFNKVGILAPFLLVLMRLLQGLCVGGEGTGASIFVLEHLHNIKPGLIGGIINSSLTLGILLAITTGLFLNNVCGKNEETWRYAFYLGSALGLAGLYLRLSVDETPAFKNVQKKIKAESMPIKEVFLHSGKNMILTIAAGGVTGVSGYLVMTFLGVFFKNIMNYDTETTLMYGILGNLALIIFLPLMGWISDHLGYALTICCSCVMVLIFSIPLFHLLSNSNPLVVYFAIIAISFISAGIYAPLYPYVLNLFLPEHRYSGIAFSLNIGIALFGGTSTVICISLIKCTDILFMPAVYWVSVCSLFLLTMLWNQREENISRASNRNSLIISKLLTFRRNFHG